MIRRNTILLLAVLGSLVLGCAAGVLAMRMFAKPATVTPQPQIQSPAAPTILTVKRQLYYSSDESQEPRGYLITLSGPVNLTVLATQEIDEQSRDLLPLIQGQTLKTDEYYWTGLRTDIHYVKSDDKFQIVREVEPQADNISDTESTAMPKEVLLTVDIPPGTTVNFEEAKK